LITVDRVLASETLGDLVTHVDFQCDLFKVGIGVHDMTLGCAGVPN
jgi:hypothetical protein